ncbi:hypothetical protein [Sinomonas susongensis]|uniref:hypothetical protein n=1 Tax=Sinomonas susongensis TaxID=1324851 RepID=UPI001109401D|nr:hypothetical protein [Sinomonas susongensis]
MATIKGSLPRRTRRSAIAVAASAALVLGGAGAAIAYWSTTGSGPGSAAAGQLQTLTTQALVQAAPGQAPLSPGGTADVVLKVTNPNGYPVQLYSVSSAGGAVPDAAHSRCVTTGVTFQNPSAPLAPAVTIPANGTQTVTLPGSVSMSMASDAGCQGAFFNVPLTLEVRK